MNYLRMLISELALQLRMLKTWAGLKRFLVETTTLWTMIVVVSFLPWQGFAVLGIGLAAAALSWLTGKTNREATATGATAALSLAGILCLPYVVILLSN